MLSQNPLKKLFTLNSQLKFLYYVSFGLLLKFIEYYKILDPQNTHERKFWTHEIPRRKNLRPTKYPREEFSDPR